MCRRARPGCVTLRLRGTLIASRSGMANGASCIARSSLATSSANPWRSRQYFRPSSPCRSTALTTRSIGCEVEQARSRSQVNKSRDVMPLAQQFGPRLCAARSSSGDIDPRTSFSDFLAMPLIYVRGNSRPKACAEPVEPRTPSSIRAKSVAITPRAGQLVAPGATARPRPASRRTRQSAAARAPPCRAGPSREPWRPQLKHPQLRPPRRRRPSTTPRSGTDCESPGSNGKWP